jgi:hypothetical protein
MPSLPEQSRLCGDLFCPGKTFDIKRDAVMSRFSYAASPFVPFWENNEMVLIVTGNS